MVYLVQEVINAGDHAVSGVYDKVMGGDKLQLAKVDLNSLVPGGYLAGMVLEFDPIGLPGYKNKSIRPLRNWIEGHAKVGKVFPITNILPVDQWIPLDNVGKVLNKAVQRVLPSLALPGEISTTVHNAVGSINGAGILNSVPTDLSALLGIESTAMIVTTADEAQAALARLAQAAPQGFGINCNPNSRQFHDQADNLVDAMSEFATSMAGVKQAITDMPDKILELIEDKNKPTNALTVLRKFLSGLFDVLEDILSMIWPALKAFDFGPVVRVTNLFQDVLVWPIAYMVTCVSIGTHLIIIGQLVVSVQLWRAHQHMKKDDNAVEDEEAAELGDLANDSAQVAGREPAAIFDPSGTPPVERPAYQGGALAGWGTVGYQTGASPTRPADGDAAPDATSVCETGTTSARSDGA
jgi:hypothetical protein